MPEQDAVAAGTLGRALGDLRLREPRSWRGLTVFPLLSEREDPPAYDGLGPALAAGTFRITEVSEAGVVPRLRAVNEGPRPVLLLDGEEVVGACRSSLERALLPYSERNARRCAASARRGRPDALVSMNRVPHAAAYGPSVPIGMTPTSSSR